ncbi:hypothetical protein Ddye_020085 [Dipteronia dyeriana]|uniref:Uncharacterized protein n=1 Tax=Dipteronia dyeriana TaxID=168575 RepID=A0AAD9U043_9ROSI|nr:hypothetical protein Ddye_020085 [Dipteronia dyeriana]
MCDRSEEPATSVAQPDISNGGLPAATVAQPGISNGGPPATSVEPDILNSGPLGVSDKGDESDIDNEYEFIEESAEDGKQVGSS